MVVVGDVDVVGSFVFITLFGASDVVLTATGSCRGLRNVRFYHLVVDHCTSILRSFQEVISRLQVTADSQKQFENHGGPTSVYLEKKVQFDNSENSHRYLHCLSP